MYVTETVKSLLQLKNISLSRETMQHGENGVKTFAKSKLLDDFSIDVWKGYIHAIIGPNGAGKSTLAHTIMGLDGYTDITGDVLFEGESIKKLSVDERARKGISIAWQEPARFEGISVKTFLEKSATTRELTPKEVKTAIDESLQFTTTEI